MAAINPLSVFQDHLGSINRVMAIPITGLVIYFKTTLVQLIGFLVLRNRGTLMHFKTTLVQLIGSGLC